MKNTKTEGINYAGSKLKLIPHILDMVSNLQGVNSVLDGFSGSTRVSQALAANGYEVTSNDISDWSEIFGICYLKANQSDNYYNSLIAHLNQLAGFEGWFTTYYGGSITDSKKPFRTHNTMKLDAIREEIDRLALSYEDKCVALTSLIQALDRVDNTLGHYAAYLSKWSVRSAKEMVLKVPSIVRSEKNHTVIKGDIFDTVDKHSFDLAYLDPPYGSNNEKMPPSRVRYAAYYHLWTTIIRNDQPEIFGKVNRRSDTKDGLSASVFEEFRKNKNGDFMAMEALRTLIQKTNSRYIMLSYSSGGRATQEQLLQIISENAKLIKVEKIDYRKNIMSTLRSTNEWISDIEAHQEYIFLMEKIQNKQ